MEPRLDRLIAHRWRRLGAFSNLFELGTPQSADGPLLISMAVASKKTVLWISGKAAWGVWPQKGIEPSSMSRVVGPPLIDRSEVTPRIPDQSDYRLFFVHPERARRQ